MCVFESCCFFNSTTTTTTAAAATAFEFSLGGSRPYTNADKTNENKYT